MATPVINLSTLNGNNGFTINGVSNLGYSGRSVNSAGDINGDGFDDVIIGAPFANLTLPNGGGLAGQAYVVFGGSSRSRVLNAAALNGKTGFRISGLAGNELLGRSVSSAGDINGDGIDDLIVGSDGFANGSNNNAGRSYVIFGSRSAFSANFNLATLDGSNGFYITGREDSDRLGRSVSNAGDLNGDGIDDLVVGAPYADPNSRTNAGQVYVVFGSRNGFNAALVPANLNGANGFRFNGRSAYDRTGYSVSAAGDINGDGIDDLIVGAPYADSNGTAYTGQSYVIFGSRSGFAANFSADDLNGANGFRINGSETNDYIGFSVSGAGDINGDGIDDLIMGASGQGQGGTVYVVLGKRSGFSANLNLSTVNGTNGFRIISGSATSGGSQNQFGISVSAAGDVNGDGYGDVIIGAPAASPNGQASGQSYVLFGRGGKFLPQINLTTLNGKNGFTINGIQLSNLTGRSVRGAGDVNGDGIADLVIGAEGGRVTGTNAGQSYVIFGVADPISGLTLTSPTVDASKLTLGSITVNLGTASLTINKTPSIYRKVKGFKNVLGTSKTDSITGNRFNNSLTGNGGADTLLGAGGNDYVSGNAGADSLTGGGGKDYFIFDLNSRFKRNAIGVDTLTDFAPGKDKISLDRTTFTTLGQGKVSFASVADLAQAKLSQAQITYIAATGSLYYNPNRAQAGFGFGGQFADLTDGLTLTANNFRTQA